MGLSIVSLSALAHSGYDIVSALERYHCMLATCAYVSVNACVCEKFCICALSEETQPNSLHSYGVNPTIQAAGGALGAATLTNIALLPAQMLVLPNIIDGVRLERQSRDILNLGKFLLSLLLLLLSYAFACFLLRCLIPCYSFSPQFFSISCLGEEIHISRPV